MIYDRMSELKKLRAAAIKIWKFEWGWFQNEIEIEGWCTYGNFYQEGWVHASGELYYFKCLNEDLWINIFSCHIVDLNCQ